MAYLNKDVQVSANFNTDFNLDVQERFLQLLVFDSKWASISGLEIIKPEFFENRVLHNICKWIHEHYKRYKRIPEKMVLMEKAKDYMNLNGLGTKDYFKYQEVIDSIFTFNEDEDLEFFKDQVITFIKQSAWKQMLSEGTEILRSGNYEEALSAFKKVLQISAENDFGLELEETDAERFVELLKEDYDKVNMIQTGVPGWDEALGGGFVKKNLHLIGACFVGKTKIKTSKGNKSFEELAALDDYSDLDIYSINEKGIKVKNQIEKVFKTKQVKQLIYLKLNNGKAIYCTPDHYFVIKNPKTSDLNIIWENNIAYKQAQYLEDDDEL